MSDNHLEVNLEHWMANLPEKIKDIPLIYLAIPGSHDSMTYGINRSSGLAPDAEPVLHRLFPLFRGTIIRWTVTQAVNTLQQLLLGIRYLDLRIATKVDSENFYFTHGLYANQINESLEQVKDFVDSHPGEVVILDFQHFYALSPEDHMRLIKLLINTYGHRLVPRLVKPGEITLNSLSKLKQQVIVVYRHGAVEATGEFWPSCMLPSPWPRQETTRGLLQFLRAVRRHPSAGFVHQAVLTPTVRFIVFRWMSSLRKKCAIPVKDDVLPALREFTPGPVVGPDEPTPVNVLIADFVDLDDAIFPKTIIELNTKLMKNTDIVYHSDG